MSAGYVVKTGTTATALVAATAKTVVNLISGAADSPLVTELSIGFDGVTASAVPVLVDFGYSTQATAGTPGTSPTPTLIRGRGTAGSTAAVDYSAEPTALTAFILYLVGTGPVQGFAITLIIGIAASMVTAIYVVRSFFLFWIRRRPDLQTLSV